MTKPVSLLSFFLIVMTCLGQQNNDFTEFETIVNQLKQDENHVFLRTLKPSMEDCKLIFLEGESVEKAIIFSDSKWVNIDKVSSNSMKPLTDDAKINILSVTKNELQSAENKGFPEEYTILKDHIKDGIMMYALQYLNPDGTEQKHRAAFFKVLDHWIIIPQTFKAFE